jgi:hypothetical protein
MDESCCEAGAGEEQRVEDADNEMEMVSPLSSVRPRYVTLTGMLGNNPAGTY